VKITIKTYDNEDYVCNEGMDGQNELQSAECFSELAALANNEVVIDDHCILDKRVKAKNEII